MILYEYDDDGWLIGWHEDAVRPQSTDVPPPYGPRSRWNGTAWISDDSRERAIAQADIARAVDAVVQRRLDAHARTWGYASIEAAMSWMTSTVPQFAAEAAALRDWRDATWAEVVRAQATVASQGELIARLPPPPARPT